MRRSVVTNQAAFRYLASVTQAAVVPTHRRIVDLYKLNRDLVLHHGAKLLSQFGTVGVAVGGDGVLGGSLQHFELSTRDRQGAVRLTRKIPAIDDFSRHRPSLRSR